FAGTVALRARFLQQRHRHGEALPLIADLLRATKKLSFLDWACASVAALGNDLELPALLRLTRETWATSFGKDSGEDDRRRLAQFVGLLRAQEPRFGRSGEFLAVASMVLRRSGDLAGALAWAERAYAAAPNFMSALAVANTYREQGQLDEYLRWIRITD